MPRKRNREAGGQYAKEGTTPRAKRPPMTSNERRLLAVVTSMHPTWFRARTLSEGLTLAILARKQFLKRRLYSGKEDSSKAKYEYRASSQMLVALAREGVLTLGIAGFKFILESNAVIAAFDRGQS